MKSILLLAVTMCLACHAFDFDGMQFFFSIQQKSCLIQINFSDMGFDGMWNFDTDYEAQSMT